MVEGLFEKMDRKLDEIMEKMRAKSQRLAGLEQESRQPRLAMKADVPSDTKIRNRIDDVAADRTISVNSSFANQVNPDQMHMTSFGDDFIGPTTSPCSRDGTLVDNGAGVLKPCFSPVKMRTLPAAGGLLPTGKASTATMAIFH